MAEEVEFPFSKIDPNAIAHEIILVIRRGGAPDVVEDLRQLMLDLISRSDNPDVFHPILKALTILHDGKLPKPVPPAIPTAKTVELKGGAATVEAMPSRDILPKGSQRYLRNISKFGFLDDDLRLLPDTSRSEAMYIVYKISKALESEKIMWKPFEEYWGIKNLAQERWKWENRMSISPRISTIDKAFAS